MSWFRRSLQPTHKPTEVNSARSASVHHAPQAMPIVKFDPSAASKSVKVNLRRNIEMLDDIEKKHVKQVYGLALRSIEVGGDLHLFCTGLMNLHIEGMITGRAAEIGRSLSNKAKAIIDRESQAAIGISHATWMYANAPCMKDPSHPVAADIQRDAAHHSANGK